MPDTALPDTTVVTESFWTPNVRQQVVTQATSVTRPTGVEGRLIFEADTDRYMFYDGSGWVEVYRAGAWASWTPVVTQSGAVAVTNTRSLVIQVGKTVTATFDLTVTGSGTASNQITITLPVTGLGSGAPVGVAELFDSSANLLYRAQAKLISSGAIVLSPSNVTTVGNLGAVGFTAGLASNDLLRGTFTYPAA